MFAKLDFDAKTQAHLLDMTSMAEQLLRGAYRTMQDWTEPRIFLLAMDRVRELDPAWWHDAKHLPMEQALDLLRQRHPVSIEEPK